MFKERCDRIHPPPVDFDHIMNLARMLFDPQWESRRHHYPEHGRFPGRARYGGCAELGMSRLLAALSDRKEDEQQSLDKELDLLLRRWGERGRLDEFSGGRCPDKKPGFVSTRFRLHSHLSVPRVAGAMVKNSLQRAWCTLCGRSGFQCPEEVIVHIVPMPNGLWGDALSVSVLDRRGNEEARPVIRLNKEKLAFLIDQDPPPDTEAEEWDRYVQDAVQALVTHEFFHTIEYEYGFRTEWLGTDARDVAWLSEGLATWAEAFVSRSLFPGDRPGIVKGAFVHRTSPLLYMPLWGFWKQEAALSKPGLNPWQRGYDALPMWLGQEPTAWTIQGGGTILNQQDRDLEGEALTQVPVDEGKRLSDAARRVRSFLSEVDESPQEGPKAVLARWLLEQRGVKLDTELRVTLNSLAEDSNYSHAKSGLDEERRFLRPYNVKVGALGWHWEHRGRVAGGTVRFFRFLAEDEPDLEVKIRNDNDPDERVCLNDPSNPPAEGLSTTCFKVDLGPGQTIAVTGNGDSTSTYTLTASRPASDAGS
jgi:hypothetical protein